MSYQVLARKWRPRTFQDMIGQEYILRMLTNALQQQRIHHAYLFTGTRGVGKTTLARILAKCLNCESGVTPLPCGTCHTCLSIDAGKFLDLFEIDAASRTKVEDTRELLDNVLYAPTQGRYKIYLIDEVHMLSNHSFNALLKTLEEPPSHVKFLLATTEPKRLPITILSRCLQFHLKKIVPEQIAAHLQHICTIENVAFELQALERLAKSADGSMRDALSLLDQAIAYGQGNVTKNDINAMLGNMAQDDLLPLVEALAARDGKQLFNIIADLATKAPDFQQVLEELISLFHKIAVAQAVPSATFLEASITPFVKRISPEDIQLYYQIALLGKRDLSLTPSPQQGFEMTMIRMLTMSPCFQLTSNITEKKTTPKAVTATEPSSTLKPSALGAPSITSDAHPTWRELLPKLELSGMAYALAANCTLKKLANNQIELALSANHQPMLNQKLKERLLDALNRYFNQSMQLEIKISTDELMTPAKQEQKDQDDRLAQATQTILEDPQIKRFIDMYDATVHVSLVT